MTADGTARAVPFYCPFCGEEAIRPFGESPDAGHGDWRCEDCTRVFTVRYKGITGAPTPESGDDHR